MKVLFTSIFVQAETYDSNDIFHMWDSDFLGPLIEKIVLSAIYIYLIACSQTAWL